MTVVYRNKYYIEEEKFGDYTDDRSDQLFQVVVVNTNFPFKLVN